MQGLIWVTFKKSETAAMMGCFLVWVYPSGLLIIQAPYVPILFSSILPTIFTVLIIRMLRFIYMLAKEEPPIPAIEPTGPPKPPELELHS